MRLFLGLLCIYSIFPITAQAAVLTFMPHEVPVRVGEPLHLSLLVDSDVSLNAVEGVVRYDPQMVSFKQHDTHTGVIRFWLRQPYLCDEDSVCFSGISPGGFSGFQQELVTLEFTPLQSGTTTIFYDTTRLFKHDGKGTEVSVSVQAITVDISPQLIGDEPRLGIDEEPPEAFTPLIVQDRDLYEGAHVLIFSTLDKQSGIASYFVKEVIHPWLVPFVSWKEISSPYVLQDQTLSSFIYIRAVDREENQRIVTVAPAQQYASASTQMFIVISLLIITFFSSLRLLVRKRIHRRAVEASSHKAR